MYIDLDHREWWVQVLEVVTMGVAQLVTVILTEFIASDIFIENGKGILIIQSMFFSCRFERKTILYSYSGVQISWQRVFWAENHQQNFDTSLLTYKCWLIFMAMKQKKIFLKKKNQNGRRSFSSFANSEYFFSKISWIGSWVSRIDWCKGIDVAQPCQAVRRKV